MNETPSTSSPIEVVRFRAPVPYREALRLQQERRAAVEQGRMGNALFLLEHPPVITLGRRAREENLLRSREELARMGIEVCEADRGGDVTYHGPGILVAYPILDLKQWRPSIRWYLRALEEVVMRVLAGFGIEGRQIPGYTGVWVGDEKVAAIGVRVHKWVTSHGIALNVDPDMSHFGFIIPCGIVNKRVTSLRHLLADPPRMSAVMKAFGGEFVTRFERWPVRADTAEILK